MSAVEHLNQFEFHHVIEMTPGVALVFFTAPACGTCRQLKEMLVWQAAHFADIRLFEVDAGQELALTREFGVFHLPAMFLYRDGQFHCELHSEMAPAKMRAAINEALAAPPQEAP